MERDSSSSSLTYDLSANALETFVAVGYDESYYGPIRKCRLASAQPKVRLITSYKCYVVVHYVVVN